MKRETSWTDIQRTSGYPTPVDEYTSVSGTLRRVAHFDMDLVKRAALVNRPTHLAVHGLDYLDYQDYGKTAYPELSEVSKAFVCRLEDTLGVPATFLFSGPPNGCLIDRRHSSIQQLKHREIAIAG